MFFSMGGWELVVIGLVAVLIFGPDRLPRMISEAASWLRVFRTQATKARSDLMGAVDLDPSLTDDLRQTFSDIAELHPKRIASSLINDTVNGTSPQQPRPTVEGPAGGAPVFDPDAT